MGRIILILFQVAMAIFFFGWCVLMFRESFLPQEATFVTWSVRFRAFCAFLIGTLFTYFSMKNVKRVFAKKSAEEESA